MVRKWNEILDVGIVLVSFLTIACGRGAKMEQAASSLKPLPDSGFRVEWGTLDFPAALQPGQSVTAKVTVKNSSDQTWLDLKSVDPSTPCAVRMSHRWWDSEMKQPVGDWVGRAELPNPLAPGESVTLSMEVTAPTQPGSYKLQFDLVQELVAWFASKGTSRLIVPVEVK